MKIKSGVKLTGVRAEIILAMQIAANIYRAHGHELVITSVTDGKHGMGSLHYVGQAVDLRTSYFSRDEAAQVTVELREALGENYDVILEHDHIHVEFQPK